MASSEKIHMVIEILDIEELLSNKMVKMREYIIDNDNGSQLVLLNKIEDNKDILFKETKALYQGIFEIIISDDYADAFVASFFKRDMKSLHYLLVGIDLRFKSYILNNTDDFFQKLSEIEKKIIPS